jgi:hypothetical protein
VADQWYTWKTGKVFVFDDSFEHEVILGTSSPTNDDYHHNEVIAQSELF